MKTSIAITDDHHLIAQALSFLINRFEDYEVTFIAENGRVLIQHLQLGEAPDLLLLDLSMPEMDGFQTLQWLKKHTPEIKVLVLTMSDREPQIIRAIREGARGYILKGCKPFELKKALDDVCEKGYHYSDFLSEHLIRNLQPQENRSNFHHFVLNDRELAFLKLACTDLTYAEIAEKLCVSPRTVDGYREALFQKMNVKSRVSMALEAARMGIIDL